MNADDIELAFRLVPIELWNTIYMVIGSAFFSMLLGIPLGISLTVMSPGHLKPNPWLYRILGAFVNIGRSFPFIILMVALIPLTRLLVGTSIGNTAAIVPLTIAAIPFVARLIESALNEVDKNLIEAAIAMGSTPIQIIAKVMIPEALGPVIQAITLTLINLLGCSAMAGTMGAGGLGKVAIQYGYQRFNLFLIFVTIIAMIALVQTIQWIGDFCADKINQKRCKGSQK